jgi:ferrochelatase
MKRGLLLINLGTPDAAEPEAVGRYLREFLMDKWVVDIPWPLRWALVNLAIVPRRKRASAHAYEKVWGKRGSPLRYHLEDLAQGVRAEAAGEFQVEIAMRYGQPGLRAGLRSLSACEQILVFPLYPQYAESSTRSSLEEAGRQARALGIDPAKLSFVPAFYADPGFIAAFAEAAREGLAGSQPDHYLFSFHGLPEAHVRATDRSAGQPACLASAGCCERVTDANRDCYRAQCYATARALAAELGLAPGKWSVSFQSRLGRRQWIKPYTDFVYKELAQKGARQLAVLCPSFVADCLETLEEIGMRGDADFRAAGGERVLTAACPNARPSWARAVAEIARRELARRPGPGAVRELGG